MDFVGEQYGAGAQQGQAPLIGLVVPFCQINGIVIVYAPLWGSMLNLTRMRGFLEPISDRVQPGFSFFPTNVDIRQLSILFSKDGLKRF